MNEKTDNSSIRPNPDFELSYSDPYLDLEITVDTTHLNDSDQALGIDLTQELRKEAHAALRESGMPPSIDTGIIDELPDLGANAGKFDTPPRSFEGFGEITRPITQPVNPRVGGTFKSSPSGFNLINTPLAIPGEIQEIAQRKATYLIETITNPNSIRLELVSILRQQIMAKVGGYISKNLEKIDIESLKARCLEIVNEELTNIKNLAFVNALSSWADNLNKNGIEIERSDFQSMRERLEEIAKYDKTFELLPKDMEGPLAVQAVSDSLTLTFIAQEITMLNPAPETQERITELIQTFIGTLSDKDVPILVKENPVNKEASASIFLVEEGLEKKLSLMGKITLNKEQKHQLKNDSLAYRFAIHPFYSEQSKTIIFELTPGSLNSGLSKREKEILTQAINEY